MLELPMVKVELNVPKDAKEVVDLLNAVLENVMAKTPLSGWTNVVDELMAAVEGLENAIAGFQGEGRDEVAGYMVHKLLGTLMPVKGPVILPVPPVAQPE